MNKVCVYSERTGDNPRYGKNRNIMVADQSAVNSDRTIGDAHNYGDVTKRYAAPRDLLADIEGHHLTPILARAVMFMNGKGELGISDPTEKLPATWPFGAIGMVVAFAESYGDVSNVADAAMEDIKHDVALYSMWLTAGSWAWCDDEGFVRRGFTNQEQAVNDALCVNSEMLLVDTPDATVKDWFINGCSGTVKTFPPKS